LILEAAAKVTEGACVAKKQKDDQTGYHLLDLAENLEESEGRNAGR
jgi:hypothetical protein